MLLVVRPADLQPRQPETAAARAGDRPARPLPASVLEPPLACGEAGMPVPGRRNLGQENQNESWPLKDANLCCTDPWMKYS
jgi:hypothetical protein